MFGWLNQALPFAPSASAAVHRRWLRVAPANWVQQLPLLGSVLYLPSCAGLHAVGDPLPGWLAERAEWLPLLRTVFIAAVSDIDVEGPREWLECFDAGGVFVARIHLLPDTDYLAWDAMLVSAVPVSPLPFRRRHVRCAMARPVVFSYRRMAGLLVLGAAGVARLSPLGQGIAAEVAREAGVPSA